jgi:hypothetical protein
MEYQKIGQTDRKRGSHNPSLETINSVLYHFFSRE